MAEITLKYDYNNDSAKILIEKLQRLTQKIYGTLSNRTIQKGFKILKKADNNEHQSKNRKTI